MKSVCSATRAIDSAAANHAFASPVPAAATRVSSSASRAALSRSANALGCEWRQDHRHLGRGLRRLPCAPTKSSWHGTTHVYSRRHRTRQGRLRHSHVREHVAGRRRRDARQYPSGGPEPWVVDVWRPQVGPRFLCPRPLCENFVDWCRRYHRDGNPLFMPETRGGTRRCGQCLLRRSAKRPGFGFSPFAHRRRHRFRSGRTLAASLSRHRFSLAPLLLEHQSAGDVHGFVLDKHHPSADFTMNGYCRACHPRPDLRLPRRAPVMA